MSKHLLSHWDSLSRRLSSGSALLLFDFDGTLTPIVENPGRARLDSGTRDSLSRLSRRAGFRVGVVSGRALRELRRKVALPGLVLSGNHGLEISGLGERFVHPQARAQAAFLKELASSLRRDLSVFPGVWVEWKGVSVSVHYRRLAPSRAPAFKRFLRERVRRRAPDFMVRPGKKVFDILPVPGWGKGSAVRRILRRLRPRTALYAGDDRMDQDVFRALRPADFSISVGPTGRSGARYHVRGVTEMGRLLERMAHL